MEQEEVFANETTDSPHFVDDRTLRGAQPVVPLAEVRHRTITRGRLLLTFALLLAVGFGAGVALLLVQLKQNVVNSAVSVQPETTSENREDSSLAVVGEEEEMLNVGDHGANTGQEAAKKRRKKVARVPVPNAAATPLPVKVDADEDNSQQKEPVLVDQWQERRSRRATRIERRRDNNLRRRDLFRIRDIFEGDRP